MCLNNSIKDTSIVSSFICDTCIGSTTYKRLCRLEGCGKPHSVKEFIDEDGQTKRGPSKYCSVEHRDEFWRRIVAGVDSTLAAQLRGYMVQTKLGDFKNIGEKPVLVGDEAPTGPPHNEEGMFSFDIKIRDDCHKNIARISKTIMNLGNRLKLIAMVKKYSDETTKEYAEKNNIVNNAPKRTKDNKSGKSLTHTVCGYDPRLMVTDKWITSYMDSAEGAKAFEAGVIGEHTNPDFRIETDPDYYKGICVKTNCARHREWYVIHYEDSKINQQRYEADLVEQTEKLNDMYDRVQLRIAIKRERNLYVKKKVAEMSEETAAEFMREWTTLKGDPDLILQKLLIKAFPGKYADVN